MFKVFTKGGCFYKGSFNFLSEAEAYVAERARWEKDLYIEEFTPKYAMECLWSDVNPYEIVRKISDLTYEVRAMKATISPSWKPEVLIGGFSGHTVNNDSQEWIIESDETAPVTRIRYSRAKGRFFCKGGMRFVMEETPWKKYDYNF